MYYRKSIICTAGKHRSGYLYYRAFLRRQPACRKRFEVAFTTVTQTTTSKRYRPEFSGSTPPVLQLKTHSSGIQLAGASEESQPYTEILCRVEAESFHRERIAGTEVASISAASAS